MIDIRPMRADDAQAVAGIHAASWRDAYRGILSDTYLDVELPGDRQRPWRERLVEKPAPSQIGLMALDGASAVGFAYALRGASELRAAGRGAESSARRSRRPAAA